MGFVGFEHEIDWRNTPAGEYYVIEDTGEVFDTEYSVESACWDGDGYVYGYTIRKVDYWYITRQNSFYREHRSINISRHFDNIPPGMLCGNADFPSYETADTETEALELAKEWAIKWSKMLEGEPVEIENDSAECGGDTVTLYINGEEVNEYE